VSEFSLPQPNTDPNTTLPTSPNAIRILLYILKQEQSTGINQTPILSRKNIALGTGVAPGSINTTLRRLQEQGFIIRLQSRPGSTTGGTAYSVPKHLYPKLAKFASSSPQKPAQPDTHPDTSPPVVVSSFINNTTNNRRGGEYDEALKEILERTGLAEFLIGLSDILPLYRRFVVSGELSFDEFKAGLFHLGFYLGSPEHSQGIDKPKTWAISQLKKNGGYYPEPASYISPQEAREQAILKDKMNKLERLKQIKDQQFELDYQLWVSELPDSEKRHIAGLANPSGRIAEEALKEAFRAQREGV